MMETFGQGVVRGLGIGYKMIETFAHGVVRGLGIG